ncbi:MAG TPA: acyl-CoA carboxylase subunit beta, partial [Bacteroidia bacterium]|nr:acyl-CoA carboxylase subunit beta [Bacteroidia bacterium]
MAENIEFNKNEDYNKTLISNMRMRLAKVAEGGGKKNAAKQHEKGKLLARERIDYLLDKDSPRIEIGAFAADGMYEEQGGCPS